jgi:hypothetical protein
MSCCFTGHRPRLVSNGAALHRAAWRQSKTFGRQFSPERSRATPGPGSCMKPDGRPTTCWPVNKNIEIAVNSSRPATKRAIRGWRRSRPACRRSTAPAGAAVEPTFRAHCVLASPPCFIRRRAPCKPSRLHRHDADRHRRGRAASRRVVDSTGAQNDSHPCRNRFRGTASGSTCDRARTSGHDLQSGPQRARHVRQGCGGVGWGITLIITSRRSRAANGMP